MNEKQKTAQERVARILCALMDDEWQLGRDLYMETASEIMATLGHEDLVDALKDLIDNNRKSVTGEQARRGWATARAAIAKAEGRGEQPS